MPKLFWLGLFGLLVGSVLPAHAQPGAGRIKSASGSAFVIRNGAEIPAKPGESVFESDGLKTGADGRLAVTLKDETRLSLGPDTEARLDRFIYAPSAGRLGFTLEVVRGLLAYVSGRIAKLAPDAVRLQTPAAIIGVRGTRLAIRVDRP